MKDNNFSTGMYIVDEEYKILYYNAATKLMYPEINTGDFCYKILACGNEPCSVCPIGKESSLFYNPIRKEWISAQSSDMEYEDKPCRCVQFQLKQRLDSRLKKEDEVLMAADSVAEFISEIRRDGRVEKAIATYSEPGSPIFYISEPLAELLGYENSKEFMRTLDGLAVNIMHPDDRAQVKRDMSDPYTPGATYESTYRMPKKDGTWIWTVTKGKVVKTASGRLAMINIISEMSEMVRDHVALSEKNKSLETKEQRSATMMHNIPGAYHRCAAEEGLPLIYVSKSFRDLVGWNEDEIKRDFDNKLINLVYPDDIPLFEKLFNSIDENNQGSAIYRIKRKGGGYRWVQDSTMYVESDGESYYQCTLSDVNNYIESLNEAMKRVEAGSRAKSTFLFNASHDIRTPMNAILGFTQMIEKNPQDSAFVASTIVKIKEAGGTLMKLLNDVLELSRIESGKDELDLLPTNLDECIEKLYLMFKSEIEDRGIDLHMFSNIQNSYVMADSLKLTRIGMNMLSNAKKFTPPGGKIVFGIEELPVKGDDFADYRFFVRDTGIGMSREFKEKAFVEFERERTSTDSGVSGSGLGLAIIKKLVDLMGGNCTIESELGDGTEISAVLRLSFADPEKRAAKEEMFKDLDFSGKRVLLVEDNDFNREIARFMLDTLGVETEEARNGLEAVDALLKHDGYYYDLILMDVQMPIMDGYTATREIRHMNDKKVAETPIIAMTANAFREDRDKCFSVGMNGHLGKPIDMDSLSKKLMECFGK